MNSPTLSLLLFSLSWILIFHSPLPANADLMHDVCKNAKEEAACMQYFKTYPEEFSSLANTRELARLALQLVLKKASENQGYLSFMVMKDDSKVLKDCAFDTYKNAIVSFKTALDLVEANDLESAKRDAIAGSDNVSDCKTKLESGGFQNDNELHSRNAEILTLIDLAVAATSSK